MKSMGFSPKKLSFLDLYEYLINFECIDCEPLYRLYILRKPRKFISTQGLHIVTLSRIRSWPQWVFLFLTPKVIRFVFVHF